MKIDNMAVLWETLERMEIQQLDAILLEELRKESLNGDLIRLISSVLKERDKDIILEIDDNIQQAWERYQKKTQPVHKKPKVMNSFLLKVASLFLVLFTLMVFMPQEAQAMSFFERFITWTESVFSLISPAEIKEQKDEYVFRTSNSGLQTVYDQVVELGVTVPVVPMWLPEGYGLVKCNVQKSPAKTVFRAGFSNHENDIVYELDIYSENITYEYYINKTENRAVEKNGITHRIMHNNDLSVIVWTVDNIQCSIFLDCQEDTLNRILDSIYTMEDN